MTTHYTLYLILDELYVDKFFRHTQILYQGISCVQLRMKTASIQTVEHTAKKLLDLLKPLKIPLIIDNHVTLVKKINAQGVHIGQTDMPYGKARKYLGNNKIIGLSIANECQAKLCRHFSADYFGIGPIFPTPTKFDAARPLGIENLQKILCLFSRPVPLVAIGGITQNNAPEILQTGVSGIAVCSAILGADSPENATKKFSELLAS